MKNNLKTIISVTIGVLILGGIIWFSRPTAPVSQTANLGSKISKVLAAAESAYDFGEISMAAGTVSHRFEIKNLSGETMKIEKIYTSCMCTTAQLTITNKSFGPYGMPGHGSIPRINETLSPNEKMSVEVMFDPAAHGPAGVGRIERAIYIENSAGQPLELTISATVTP